MVPCKEHGKVMVSQKGDFVRPFFLSDKNLIAAGGVNANLSFKGSDVGVFGVLNFKRTSPSSPRRAPQDDADGAALEALGFLFCGRCRAPRTTLTASPWRRNGRPRDGHGPSFMRVIVVLVRAGMGRVLASYSGFYK